MNIDRQIRQWAQMILKESSDESTETIKSRIVASESEVASEEEYKFVTYDLPRNEVESAIKDLKEKFGDHVKCSMRSQEFWINIISKDHSEIRQMYSQIFDILENTMNVDRNRYQITTPGGHMEYSDPSVVVRWLGRERIKESIINDKQVDETENPNHHNAEESKEIRDVIKQIQNSFTLNNVVMFIPIVRRTGYNNDIVGLLNPPKDRDLPFGEMRFTDKTWGIRNDTNDIMMGDTSLGVTANTKEQADNLLDSYLHTASEDASSIICTLKIVFPNRNPSVKAITYDWNSSVDY